jgi:hypothetical protein
MTRIVAWLTLGGVAIGAAGAGSYAWYTEDWRSPRPKPPTDLEVAEAWLKCIDCQGSFLKRIGEVRGESRDTITRLFSSALLAGPGSIRLARREQGLQRSWHADSIYRDSLGVGIPERDSIVALYLRGFEVTWRSRAAKALGVIGSNEALAALDSASRLPLCTKGDTVIHRAVQQAKPDTGSAVPVSPPAGPATGRISGTVFKPTGSPQPNAQVFVVGTALSALTGPDGNFLINYVPAGSRDIRAAFIGYRQQQVRVTIVGGQTTTRNITLCPP